MILILPNYLMERVMREAKEKGLSVEDYMKALIVRYYRKEDENDSN